MLMMGNKKKLTETLIGKMKSNADFVQKIGDKSKPMEKNTEVDEDADPGVGAAVSELISSIHSKDEKGVRRALDSYFQLKESKPHDEYEGEEQD
jgi:hypothetical protein